MKALTNKEQIISDIYLAIKEGKLVAARNIAETFRSKVGDFPDLQEAIALLDRFALLAR